MNQAPLTEKELAARYGVHVRTIQNWRAANIGPAWIVIGKNTIRYRMEDVLAYEAEQTKNKPEETKND